MKAELIRNVPLFANLTDEEQRLLVQVLQPEQHGSGAAIFSSGTPGHALYLVSRGFVRLTTADGLELASIGAGSLLGEAEFFRGVDHKVSAVAVSDVELLSLGDKALRELLRRNPGIGLTLSRNFGQQLIQMEGYLMERLAATEALGDLPRNVLLTVARRLFPQELPRGATLFRAGERPQNLFLLEGGGIELRPDADDPEQGVRRVQPGQILGALPVISNRPYSHSAQALADSLLWGLSAADFHAISSQYPILSRVLGRRLRGKLSVADQTQAVIRLAQTPIFAAMGPQNLHAIAQRLVPQFVRAGEPVYRIGEPGDALYLVEQGEIELTAEKASGVAEELARIVAGGFFGEMSLHTGANRTDHATVIRDTSLWVLYKADLDELSHQYPSIGSSLNRALAARLAAEEQSMDEQRFRRFQLLANMPSPELRQVVRHLRPTRYRASDQIYRAGTPGDTLFLIERGHVRMQPLAGAGWLLGAGEIFGEKSVLTNQLQGQSAIAETDVDLWTLSRTDLEELMMRVPGLAVSLSRLLSQRLAEPGAPAVSPPPAGQVVSHGGAVLPSQRRRAAAAARPPGAGGEQRAFSAVEWFTNLSVGAKLRLALLVLLLIYLFGVAAPAALRSLLNSVNVARGAVLPVSASVAGAAAEGSVADLALASADAGSAAVLGAPAGQEVPATPTYTPFPTDTPIPTDMPTVTPTPTDTPTPLPTPTFTPVPPTPIPMAQVQAAEVEAPPAPPEPPRAWDPRLNALGVTVADAPVGSGQQYWRLIEAIWQNEQEAGGKHHIFVEVLDEAGNRIVGQSLTVSWRDGSETGATEDKRPPDYAYNFPMYMGGNSYNVRIEGLPSDTVQGVGMGTPGERRTWTIHTNFLLTFQRTTKP